MDKFIQLTLMDNTMVFRVNVNHIVYYYNLPNKGTANIRLSDGQEFPVEHSAAEIDEMIDPPKPKRKVSIA